MRVTDRFTQCKQLSLLLVLTLKKKEKKKIKKNIRFRYLFEIIASRSITLVNLGHVFRTLNRSAYLYATIIIGTILNVTNDWTECFHAAKNDKRKLKMYI